MEDDGNKEIGEILRKARRDRELSQQELADALGLTQDTISLIERGKRPLKVVELRALSKVLGMPVVDFFLEDKDPEEEGLREQSIAILKIMPQHYLRVTRAALLTLYNSASKEGLVPSNLEIKLSLVELKAEEPLEYQVVETYDRENTNTDAS